MYQLKILVPRNKYNIYEIIMRCMQFVCENAFFIYRVLCSLFINGRFTIVTLKLIPIKTQTCNLGDL